MKKNINNEMKPSYSHLMNGSSCEMSSNSNEWNVNSSIFSKSTCNPVRKLVEQMKIEPNPNFQMIALSIGDPTILSHIGKPDTVTNAIIKHVQV